MTPSRPAKPILFTPGPVRVPPLVREYLADPPCNYHRQPDFCEMFEENERDMKALVGIKQLDAYFATVITSTGTGANEACLLAFEGLGKGMLVSNGFFGARVADQAAQNHIDHVVLEQPYERPIDVAAVEAALDQNPDIKWVFFVSHETRVGLTNPLTELGAMCKARGLMVAVDVVSSSYAYPIDLEAAGVDLAVASSAKALMAAPGLGVVFVKLASLPVLQATQKCRGYYLDIVSETEKQRSQMQPRFAQPVVLHAAVRAACIHMKNVGIDRHMARIQDQMQRLITHLDGLGMPPILEAAYRSNIAVNFRLPETVPYSAFATKMQAEGFYVLYGIPGDQTHFQLSTIGDLSDQHVDSLTQALTRLYG